MECRLCDENSNPAAIWISQDEYWKVHVCWFQHTLGSLGIILKRHVESFTELRDEEIVELGNLLKINQLKISEKLSPDWFNIQMNGNWHHHLHFLLLPRYQEKREFAGLIFYDKTFGEPISYTKDETADSLRKQLTDLLA